MFAIVIFAFLPLFLGCEAARECQIFRKGKAVSRGSNAAMSLTDM
jgi:hypothetical protein